MSVGHDDQAAATTLSHHYASLIASASARRHPRHLSRAGLGRGALDDWLAGRVALGQPTWSHESSTGRGEPSLQPALCPKWQLDMVLRVKACPGAGIGPCDAVI